MELTLGQRIFYTGDMANFEDAGTVIAVNPPTKFSRQGDYNLELDDGRVFRRISPLSFDPGPGRRFMPLDEYHASRRKEIQLAQKAFKQLFQSKGVSNVG